ncbi:MAG: hypothetical protein R3D33_12835 [Hyphomicrobiaceae bacterium]
MGASGPADDTRATVRVVLPYHLRNLAGTTGEIAVAVERPVTPQAVLDAVEADHPVLKGTIRDTRTLRRRPFVRYFALARDVSNDPPDHPLPEAIAAGTEPFRIVGAMSGG